MIESISEALLFSAVKLTELQFARFDEPNLLKSMSVWLNAQFPATHRLVTASLPTWWSPRPNSDEVINE